MSLAVRFEEQARGVERGMMAKAREGIGEKTVRPGRVEGSTGGQEGKAKVRGKVNEVAIDSAVIPEPVAVDLHEDVAAAVNGHQRACSSEGFLLPVSKEVTQDGPFSVACESNDVPTGEAAENRALKVAIGEVTAKRLIALAGRAKQRKE